VGALTAAAVIGLSLVGAGPAAAGGGHHGGGSSSPIVAAGLNNPRQLSFTRSGELLVAEAGTGGTEKCLPGPEGGEVCFGTTGSVTKIDHRGRQSRIITGLPSLAGEDRGSAIGPSDVYSDGRHVSVLIGLGADPAVRADLPASGQRMGTLIQTTKNYKTFRTIADFAAWEQANNPVNDPDSNPVGMLSDRGNYVVADAGGNTVLKASSRGKIHLLATFADRLVDAPPFLGLPPGTKIPMQAVPTSVATKGHDGAYYVSQLTGFPFPKGAANIYRIDPRKPKAEPTVYASGLTNVTDLAFNGRDLYAVQMFTDGLLSESTGSLVKVQKGVNKPKIVAGDLPAPYGIAIRHNTAYVTTGSVLADKGQVVRIKLR